MTGAPSGTGSQAAPGAAEASPPSVSIPSAFAIAVSLSKNDGRTSTHTMTLSWRSDCSRDEAIVDALEHAREVKPGFSIDDYLVAEIAAVEVCNGIWANCPNAQPTLERGFPVMRCRQTGRHPDHCAASAIEAQRAATPKSDAVHESAAPQEDAQ
jgi:hypothetical protein